MSERSLAIAPLLIKKVPKTEYLILHGFKFILVFDLGCDPSINASNLAEVENVMRELLANATCFLRTTEV
jgi:hypothetical protein